MVFLTNSCFPFFLCLLIIFCNYHQNVHLEILPWICTAYKRAHFTKGEMLRSLAFCSVHSVPVPQENWKDQQSSGGLVGSSVQTPLKKLIILTGITSDFCRSAPFEKFWSILRLFQWENMFSQQINCYKVSLHNRFSKGVQDDG